jgi:titin
VNRTPIKATELRLEDLMEGEEFEFRVLAVNEAGFGRPSDPTEPIRLKDPFDKPGTPGQPEILDISSTSAKIRWSRPTMDGGAPVNNYRIEMRSAGTYRWDLCNPTQKCTGTDFLVTGLSEDTDYEFRVSAENKAGVGAPSTASRTAKYGMLYLKHVVSMCYNVFCICS